MRLTRTNITHNFDFLFHFLSLKSQSFISHREQLQLLLLERLCSSTATNTTCEQRLNSKLTFIMVQTNNHHLSFIPYLFRDGALITFTHCHTHSHLETAQFSWTTPPEQLALRDLLKGTTVMVMRKGQEGHKCTSLTFRPPLLQRVLLCSKDTQ